MNITVIGAGNSGLAMAAHLSSLGERVTLWNRSHVTIEKLMKTKRIGCTGVIVGSFDIYDVTCDLHKALSQAEIVLVTTPANSHRELAEQFAQHLRHSVLIVLNPGRTFGALEFNSTFKHRNQTVPIQVAETQTILHTCRKTGEDTVNIIALKHDILISGINAARNREIRQKLPEGIRDFFIPATSMIETSIGNVGMILHCAPLLLNTGWTESKSSTYKYYFDGITPSISNLIEKIDAERVAVSAALGDEIESTKDWLIRTYGTEGDALYECIQNNEAYHAIDAPGSILHRYVTEDIPTGLVPLEAVGKKLGLDMRHTTLVIDLANALVNQDFRTNGRNLSYLLEQDRQLIEHLEEWRLQ